jgi:neutral ceramidase
MPHRIRVQRTAPRARTPAGTFRAGAAEVDVTPHPGLPMAGYSLAGQIGRGFLGRLLARALVLEDPAGSVVAFCVLDLMSASRYVLEKTATLTAAGSGIPIDRLVLLGTHTHTAPGGYFGNSLYDGFAQSQSGFRRSWADWVAVRAAYAVNRAAAALAPARLAFAVRPIWGISHNRSLEAFLHDPEAVSWNAPGSPGDGAPSELTLSERSIDPRLSVFAAFERDSDRPIGALAAFACHATALGSDFDLYAADWPGEASRVAADRLAPAGERPVVLIALSAAGDANAMVSGAELGPRLAVEVGRRVGEAVATSVRDAEPGAESLPVDVRWGEWNLAGPECRVAGDPATELSPRWMIGAPVLAGSEEGRSALFKAGLAWEGMTSETYPPEDPQHPKQPPLGRVAGAVRGLFKLSPSPVLPLQAIRLGDRLVVTVPGEPTTVTAWRIERGAGDAAGGAATVVLGYAGGYGGYYTTEEEYREQHYEGAHTIFGRNSVRNLTARVLEIVRSEASAPPLSRVEFETGPPVRDFHPESGGGNGKSVVPQVLRSEDRVEISWRMADSVRVVLAEGPFVRVDALRDGRWKVLTHRGLPFDDRDQVMEIRVHQGLPGLLTGEAAWRVAFNLPDDLDPALPLRVRVAGKGRFRGFTARIPARPPASAPA